MQQDPPVLISACKRPAACDLPTAKLPRTLPLPELAYQPSAMAASVSIPKTIYLGTFVHSVTLTELEIGEKGAIGVNEEGVIEFVERNVGLAHVHEKYGSYKDAKIVELTGNGFYFPGFIGTLRIPLSQPIPVT